MALAVVLATFVLLVVGVLRLGWGFDQMAALFFAMGVVAGLVGGLRVAGTAEGFVAGFQSMAYAALTQPRYRAPIAQHYCGMVPCSSRDVLHPLVVSGRSDPL